MVTDEWVIAHKCDQASKLRTQSDHCLLDLPLVAELSHSEISERTPSPPSITQLRDFRTNYLQTLNERNRGAP